MAAVKVILDGAVMAAELRGPSGPVTRHLIERAEEFKVAARRQARGKAGTASRSGCLENTIVKRVVQTAQGVEIRMISDTSPCSANKESYSAAVHEGTKPHAIEGNPTLAFPWEHGPEGAGMYFFRSVWHPGTQPNRFFTDNMPIFVR